MRKKRAVQRIEDPIMYRFCASAEVLLERERDDLIGETVRLILFELLVHCERNNDTAFLIDHEAFLGGSLVDPKAAGDDVFFVTDEDDDRLRSMELPCPRPHPAERSVVEVFHLDVKRLAVAQVTDYGSPSNPPIEEGRECGHKDERGDTEVPTRFGLGEGSPQSHTGQDHENRQHHPSICQFPRSEDREKNDGKVGDVAGIMDILLDQREAANCHVFQTEVRKGWRTFGEDVVDAPIFGQTFERAQPEHREESDWVDDKIRQHRYESRNDNEVQCRDRLVQDRTDHRQDDDGADQGHEPDQVNPAGFVDLELGLLKGDFPLNVKVSSHVHSPGK